MLPIGSSLIQAQLPSRIGSTRCQDIRHSNTTSAPIHGIGTCPFHLALYQIIMMIYQFPLLCASLLSLRWASSLTISPFRSSSQPQNTGLLVLPGHMNDTIFAHSVNRTLNNIGLNGALEFTCDNALYGDHLDAEQVRSAYRKISRDPSPLIWTMPAGAGNVKLPRYIMSGMVIRMLRLASHI